MTKDQEERLVGSWEAIARALGEINETARSAISKQWPDSKPVREAIVSRLPTPEDKLKKESGNTEGPIEEWLGEFDPEEEIGPREREFLERTGKSSPSSKTTSKASGQSAAGTKTSGG